MAREKMENLPIPKPITARRWKLIRTLPVRILNLGMLLELYLGRLDEALEQYEIYQGLQKNLIPR